MRLQTAEPNGTAHTDIATPEVGNEKPTSTNLSFNHPPSLTSIAGPTYVTAQTLIQQVAYSLSDALWTYSPETFDLDTAVKHWSRDGSSNVHGYSPKVQSMQIRHGAASVALGYIFSKDFDLKRRHVPQTIIGSSGSLQYLHGALDQLSLLYSLASPFVAHVAAADFAGASSQLVVDYVSALSLGDDLGMNILSSFSAFEAQHMSLFATLIATFAPTIHIYDGVSTARETTRVVDILDQAGLERVYNAVQKETSKAFRKTTTLEDKIQKSLQAFNDELGTEYGLFEYAGHPAPDSVLVAFGTVECSLAAQVANSLEGGGAKVGVLKVRLYRPFLEDEFLRVIPDSVKLIGVLGQVKDHLAVADPSIRSNLYSDVLAATTFCSKWTTAPGVYDIKYPRETVWTPVSMAASFQLLAKSPVLHNEEQISQSATSLQLLDPSTVQQFTFWDLDTSAALHAPMILGKALATESTTNVTVNTKYDNMVQGGVVRTDIRKCKKSIEAPYAIDSAEAVQIGDVSILNHFDVLSSLKPSGRILVKLSGIKNEDMEKVFPLAFRQEVVAKKCQLFILDIAKMDSLDPSYLELLSTEIAFLRIALPSLEQFGVKQLSTFNGSHEVLEKLAGDLSNALTSVTIPDSWSNSDETDPDTVPLPTDIRPSGFDGFNKVEVDNTSYLKSWKVTAKGLAFKEAFGAKNAVRPDLAIKTYTVHVKENRRLTPPSYDRNIFHIEFDLGDSGLKYDIGEALGIHAENDDTEVVRFIDFYGLDPNEIVEVPNRENSLVLENRTVWQALKQNVDIFGRPPKRFYEALSEFADDPKEQKELLTLAGSEGEKEFKRRAEVDTITFADILLEFSSAHPNFHDLVRLVSPMKRREYSIASCQKVTPDSVALMIVVVGWVDPKGRDRFGQATRYLKAMRVGAPVTVSVKPSVMKLPPKSSQPLIMAGLGTGLAPFRAFVQHRALEKAQGKDIGAVLLYMGSRHQREEYCYGEEWEAYQDAGVITLLGRAFSRDQPQKIYIQDRMRQTIEDIIQAYLREDGSFYLCECCPAFSS